MYSFLFNLLFASHQKAYPRHVSGGDTASNAEKAAARQFPLYQRAPNRAAVDMELWQTEKQIFDLETTYLEETVCCRYAPRLADIFCVWRGLDNSTRTERCQPLLPMP